MLSVVHDRSQAPRLLDIKHLRLKLRLRIGLNVVFKCIYIVKCQIPVSNRPNLGSWRIYGMYFGLLLNKTFVTDAMLNCIILTDSTDSLELSYLQVSLVIGPSTGCRLIRTKFLSTCRSANENATWPAMLSAALSSFIIVLFSCNS